MFSNRDISVNSSVTEYTIAFLGGTLFINGAHHAIYHFKLSRMNDKFVTRNYADWRVYEI